MLSLMSSFTIVMVHMIVRNYFILQEKLKSVTHEIQFNSDVAAAVVQGQTDPVAALFTEVAVMPVS